ncbi:MAG: DUF4424 domain-containing protein [Novosphingobium sp.]|nr:DUF4424 domain-containing protein [Novosphingobium sp.]
MPISSIAALLEALRKIGQALAVIRLVALAATLLLAATTPLRANDSEAEIGVGGIVRRPSRAVVLQSEDLFISEKIVRVAYRFHNPTSCDITTIVAFPMPPQPRGMMSRSDDVQERRDWSDFRFSTWVNGQPVRLRMIERAMIGNRDVTERISALGFPIYWPDENGETDLFERMPIARQQRLIAEGLARREKAFGGRLMPAWDHVAFFVREQTFPAGAIVEVRHEYMPIPGGSVGGALDKVVRKENSGIVASYRKKYCIDDHFLAGLDRRLARKRRPGVATYYSETWLGYVLSSGANWKGSIGHFRLVVDKGAANNLVSFCMDGVRKIAPTQFEVIRTGFEPTRDLDILIVKVHETGA